MAHSYAQYSGDGSNRNFIVPFPYISQAHITALVNGTPVTFTWLSSNTVQLTTAPASGTIVEIARTSSQSSRLTDFVDGSTLTESDLDTSSNQAFMMAQEALDRSEGSINLDFDGENTAKGRRIKHVANPIDPQDAATKDWVEHLADSSVTEANLAAERAEAAAAQSESVSLLVDSRSLVATKNIPSSITHLRLAGYASPGDGGAAIYKRLGSAPSPVKAWHVQSQDGAWWEMTEDRPNSAMFGVKPSTTVNASPGLQAMIDYMAAKGGGDCDIRPGTYRINLVLTLKQGVKIHGAGMGVTTLKHYGSGDHVFGKYDAVLAYDIEISDMTLDLSTTLNNAGIVVQYVERFAVRRVWITAGQVWGISIGSMNAAVDSAFRNRKVTIEDCIFSDFTITYEQILLFNSEDVLVRNCNFSNTPAGIGIGIYQFTDKVTVRDCRFTNCDRGIYYSITTNNSTIDGCTFKGGLIGIQGANESDHGLFGYTLTYGLKVTNCYFTGMYSGLELGAARDAKIIGCTIEATRETGIRIFKGNLPAGVDPVPGNITISGCTLRNNNTDNLSHISHPAILVQGPVDGLKISDCDIYDNQGIKTQLYALSFIGPGAMTNSRITASQLAAYTQGAVTGVSFGLASSPTFTNFHLTSCYGTVGSLPGGVTST